MRNLYLRLLMPFALALFVANVAVAGIGQAKTNSLIDTTKSSTKITDTRTNKPAVLSSGVKIKVVPFKPAPPKTYPAGQNGQKTQTAQQDDKILKDVKIYPNPVVEELNISYRVNKESNVTIKIMDVLGNPIATLLSQRIPAGDINNTFNLSNKLNSGWYFIRIMVGSETVVKRISVQ